MRQNKTQVFDGQATEMERWTCDSCGEKTVWFPIEDGYPQSMAGWESVHTVKADTFRHYCVHCVYARDDILRQVFPALECPEPRCLCKHTPVIHHPLERKCIDNL